MADATAAARIVAEARLWLGTPYHSGADIRGIGVDCGMFIVRVFVDAGLVPPFDPRPYPPDWHLHRADERYLGFVNERLERVERDPLPGDVILFRYGRAYSHGAIVTGCDPVTIVHAFAEAGEVIEEPMASNFALQTSRRAPVVFALKA